MPENGELLKAFKKAVATGEIPQDVSLELIFVTLIQHYKISTENQVALYGDKDTPGVVAQVRFLKWVTGIVLMALIAGAVKVFLF
jgi:hypothetical protein